MAQARKTQAEKAAAMKSKKTKKSTSGTSAKSAAKKAGTQTAKEQRIPVRVISSIAFISLFLILLITFFIPEGLLTGLLYSFIHGLIGKAGFVISIPVFLYLFYIHAFSGSRPIQMRTICLSAFVICCGCLTHLGLEAAGLPDDLSLLGELYMGGISGTTGGLVCGGVAMLIELLIGRVFSYIFLITLKLHL